MTDQGDVQLLEDPVAQELLASTYPARLAYTWRDGTPRVVAMWFQWSDGRLVMASLSKAPKLRVLHEHPEVAVTIDNGNSFPYRELMLRGRATIEDLDDVPDEYAQAAIRYFGEEQGEAWLTQCRGRAWARISLTPTWVGLLDFEKRFPSALAA